jgi:Ca2+-transporting ATPase
MTQPPRPRNASVLTIPLIKRVALNASIIILGTLAVYIHNLLDGEVTRRDTTMTFTAFVLFDMWNALGCRSEGRSILRGEVDWKGNTAFNWAVGGSLAGQAAVVYLPWLQEVFATEGLALADWVGLVMLTSSVWWADEARKWWMYGRRGGGLGGFARGYSNLV